MKQQVQTPFYWKLMKLSFLIFLVIVVVFCCLTSSIVWKSQKTDFLQNYEQTLDELVSTYDEKHNDFYRILMPLLYSDQLNVMEDFFSDDQDDLLHDYSFIQKMLTQLNNVAIRDGSILAIYFYKPVNDSYYRYLVSTKTFTKVSDEEAFCKDYAEQARVRITLGTRSIPYKISNPSTDSILNLYAIGSSSLMVSVRGEKPGVIFCYDSRELNQIVQKRLLSDQVRYYITTESGQVIFDSQEEYKKDSYVMFSNMQDILSDSQSVTINGEHCIKSVYQNSQRGYYAFYYLPEKIVWRQIITTEALLLTCALFCVMSIALCYLFPQKFFLKE